MFSPGKKDITTEEFLTAYIDRVGSIDAQELVEKMRKQFGINIPKWKIVEKANKDMVYYDPIMGRFHSSYDQFLKESGPYRATNNQNE